MSTPQLLRVFVNERLTAAAEEIFDVFERTIAKYEEEACSSQQEIERLRGMLLDLVSNQKTGTFSLSLNTSVCVSKNNHRWSHRLLCSCLFICLNLFICIEF